MDQRIGAILESTLESKIGSVIVNGAIGPHNTKV
jgi:hypothetical protein